MFHVKRVLPLKVPVLWCLSPLKVQIDEEPDAHTPLLNKEESEETGKDRLRLMLTVDSYNGISPELNSCLSAGFTGMFFGALYGGFIRSRIAYLEFFEHNQATAFRSHYEAKKVLQDHVTINFAKGAFTWGWRLALFTGSLVFVSTAVSVYRGKSGIIEYSIAGGVSGCLFRTHLGLRGMLVGGLLGSALGTVGGGLIFAFLKISGLTMEDIRGVQYNWRKYRHDARARSYKKAMDEDSLEGKLLEHHDSKIGETTSPKSESNS